MHSKKHTVFLKMNNKKSARDQKLNNSNPHTSWGNVGVENE